MHLHAVNEVEKTSQRIGVLRVTEGDEKAASSSQARTGTIPRNKITFEMQRFVGYNFYIERIRKDLPI